MAPYYVLNGITALTFVTMVPFVWIRYGAGYGLFLVEHMSSGWGSMSDVHGKTVWFELRA